MEIAKHAYSGVTNEGNKAAVCTMCKLPKNHPVHGGGPVVIRGTATPTKVG